MKLPISLVILLLSFGIIWKSGEAQAQVTFNWSDIGNAGNANASTGYGAVSYDYRISNYEVTTGQYSSFLNAKAASDPLSLYNTSMATNLNVAGVSRSGSSGSYSYSTIGSANHPITYVSFYDAVRFVNWLHNGQGSGSTETGAYTVSTGNIISLSRTSNVVTVNAIGHTLSVGDQVTTSNNSFINTTGVVTSVTSTTFTFTNVGVDVANAPGGNFLGASSTHLAGAKVWIPSENEWYKAAYYKSSNSTYWRYPTQSNSAPSNVIGSSPNNANITVYNSGVGDFTYAVTGSTYSSSQNYLTDVGAFIGSASSYGTFDQGGNAAELTEALINNARVSRGGDWANSSNFLDATGVSARSTNSPSYEDSHIGFRIASIPEPSSYAAGIAGFLLLLVAFRRRTV